MGKLILCSGARTKKPYSFPTVGMRLYSMEELCYFLFHHIYLIEEELFDETLFDWIESELKLPDRAEKLRQMKSIHADAKTMVTIILCSADYYTEYEIKSYLKELDLIAGMPRLRRNCIKADNYLRQQQYKEAEAEYEKLLNGGDASELSLEDYGDILHNLSIAKLHTSGFRTAAALFEQAYIRNQKEETLRQTLYAMKLVNDEELYEKKLYEYQVSDLLRQEIEETLKQKQEQAEQSNQMTELRLLWQYKQQGRVKEHLQGTEELIERWKGQLRQM